MKFAVGADHAGFKSREMILDFLRDQGHAVEDVGTHNEESCDYPRYAHSVAQEVASSRDCYGVLVCGSGEGMVMTANRYTGVRAALCLNESMASGTRAHNDANCLVMAERVMDEEKILPTLEAFIEGDFDGGRHERRVRKIDRPPLKVVLHPLVQRELARLRDTDTDHTSFAESLERITKLLFYEVSSSFPVKEGAVEAPLGRAGTLVVERDVVLVPIIRAGLGMLGAVRELLPESYVGHVGFTRDELSLESHEYYRNIPDDLEDPLTVLLDPMLATGGTATKSVELLKEEGLDQDLRFLSIVTAPEGIKDLHEHYPDVAVYTAALDEGLNDEGYIVPGLGDAGDRLFGTE